MTCSRCGASLSHAERLDDNGGLCGYCSRATGARHSTTRTAPHQEYTPFDFKPKYPPHWFKRDLRELRAVSVAEWIAANVKADQRDRVDLANAHRLEEILQLARPPEVPPSAALAAPNASHAQAAFDSVIRRLAVLRQRLAQSARPPI